VEELKAIKEGFLKEINAQKELYARLNPLIVEEQKALKDRDAAKIEGLVEKQEKLTELINAAEAAKMDMFEKLSVHSGFEKRSGAVLNDILKKLPAGDAKEIETAVSELIETVKETDALNSGNTHLIKNYMDYVGFVKNAKNKTPENITYNANGVLKKENQPDNKPGIDTKI